MRGFSFFLTVTISWTTAYGLTPSTSLPQIADNDFRSRLKQSSEWVSAWFGKTQPIPLLKMMKSWTLSQDRSRIIETSSLSGPPFEEWMDDAEEHRRYPWHSAEAFLNSPNFHSIWSSSKETPLSFKRITPTSYLIEFSDASILVFAHQSQPTSNLKVPAYPTFETPWPFHPDFIFGKELLGPAPGPRRPIVSSHLRRYEISSRFPPVLAPTISQATAAWNNSLQKSLFAPKAKTHATVSPWECFLPGNMCFDWTGDDAVPLTGLSAATQFAYHPVTGEKFGSMIVFLNAAKADSTLSTSVTLDPRRLPVPGPDALKQTLSLLFEALIPTQLHPQPLELVRSYLLHEIGHDLGLLHDFAASIDGKTVQTFEPSSVMDYLPWPLMHLVQKPGPLDVARIKILLGQTTAIPASALASDCSDQSVGSSMECLGGDWGPPAEWLLTASEVAPNLQTKIQVNGGHHFFLPGAFTIQEGIERLLNESTGKSRITPEMTQRLRSRLEQMPTIR